MTVSASLVSTILEGLGFRHGFDQHLCEIFERVSIEAGIVEFSARVGIGGDQYSWRSRTLDRRIPSSAGEAHSRLRDLVQTNTEVRYVGASVLTDKNLQVPGYQLVLANPPSLLLDEFGQPIEGAPREFCTFLIRTDGSRRRRFFMRSSNGNMLRLSNPEFWLATALLVLIALRVRIRHLERFPASARAAMWQSAALAHSTRTTANLVPPFDCPDSIFTISLALDLRKSTFAMEQAIDKRQFAVWLEELILILRAIGENNSGVFDKFTGDGVIVHFIPELVQASKAWDAHGAIAERQKSYSTNVGNVRASAYSAYCAIVCACEMVDAVKHHLERLRKLLSLSHASFGAGVGLAAEAATWSVDRDGQPIVVGRGLVTACRASTFARGGETLMTHAIESLAKEADSTLKTEAVVFESKEYSAKSGVQIVKLVGQPTRASRNLGEVVQVCEKVYLDIAKRGSKVLRFD